MNAVISIALLLLSTTAVKSWEPLDFQTEEEEEEDFTPMMNEAAAYYKVEGKHSGPGCTLCRLIVSKVRKELGSNSSRRNVEEKLDQVCRKVGRLLRSVCKNLLRGIKNQLVDAIMSGGSDQTVCRRVGQC